MSTPVELEPDSAAARGQRFTLALRCLAALSALLALSSLWSVERSRAPHDLQLSSERGARPGEQIALTALLFHDVDAVEGAKLVTPPTQVRLLDEAQRELARTNLRATPIATLEGALALPAGRSGTFTLLARSKHEARELEVRRELDVSDSPPTLPALGRSAGALQQLSQGPLRLLGTEPPPDRLELRVVGGACVPDLPCKLLVWVGEPGAALGLRRTASVEPAGSSAETTGIATLSLIVRGPQAESVLEVRRAGALIAERSLRLPLGLAEVSLAAPRSIVEADHTTLGFTPPPGRDYAIFDLFVRGRWAFTETVSAGERFTLPKTLTPGLVRVQARVDRFSSESSGSRLLYLRAPGEDERAALTRLTRQVAEQPELDRSATSAWVHAPPPFTREDPQLAAAFLLAPLESLRVPLHPPASGRASELARLERARGITRYGVAGALVLSALVIGLSIGRRGLSAAEQASAILDDARSDGGDPVPVRGSPLGERLRVLALVLAVAAAFLAGALLIAAKALWF